MRSLRRTLAVRFCITVFFALLLIALWAYLGAQRLLRSELDRGLAAAYDLEADVLAAGYETPRHTGPTDLDAFVASVNRFVVVRDLDGAILATNTALAVDFPLDIESLEEARRGGRGWTTQRWKGTRIRSVYTLLGHGDTTNTIIQVSASLDPLRAANREILFLMLGTVLLGTVATTIGASWISGSTVQPVLEIAEQAQGIQARTVGQRITAHGDVAEFQGLVRVLNQMLERLDQVFASQRRMIADAGHDLRTPLTAMQGEIEIALRGERSSHEYQMVLKSVLEEVQRLESISESLVLLARVEGGALVPHRVSTDITSLLEGSVQRAQSYADGRTIRLTAPPTGRPMADVDERMLTVVVDHLLDNTVRHTPPGTAVDVGVRESGQRVTITVEDDGPGIPHDRLPHLFERFYRNDAARTRTAGAGLGLSIASAIVEAHEGTIHATAGDRGGLKISIHLPGTISSD
jgi:heavy metal sensor kinase